METLPRPKWKPVFSMGCVVKVFAFIILAMNVTWHGLAALFVAGPFGLVAYLLVAGTLWVWVWVTMRRWHSEVDAPTPPPTPTPPHPTSPR